MSECTVRLAVTASERLQLIQSQYRVRDVVCSGVYLMTTV